jgi:hypothetical protein
VRHLHLLPLHRAAIFFHAGKLALHRSTNACTMACGHQGEPEFPLSHADAPAIEPMVKTLLFATVPPRSPLVMPAIEPGWERSLQVSLPSSPRAQPHLFSIPCFFCALDV